MEKRRRREKRHDVEREEGYLVGMRGMIGMTGMTGMYTVLCSLYSGPSRA